LVVKSVFYTMMHGRISIKLCKEIIGIQGESDVTPKH
jgi:hypothetical protein